MWRADCVCLHMHALSGGREGALLPAGFLRDDGTMGNNERE